MNSYELSRNFFDWSFENPEKIKPIHSAIFFFAIEHCNRLGWKKTFGLPSQMVMEAIGVKNWRTYSKGLSDLVDFGFIVMIETSKNQYSSNIIAIVKNTKAPTKALDKALSKQSTKQSQSTVQGTVSIDKQETNNNEPLNKEQGESPKFCFKKSLYELVINTKVVDEWLQVRKTKKSVNTETALKGFLNQVDKTEMSVEQVITICVERSWAGFNPEWVTQPSDKKQSSDEKRNAEIERILSTPRRVR